MAADVKCRLAVNTAGRPDCRRRAERRAATSQQVTKHSRICTENFNAALADPKMQIESVQWLCLHALILLKELFLMNFGEHGNRLTWNTGHKASERKGRLGFAERKSDHCKGSQQFDMQGSFAIVTCQHMSGLRRSLRPGLCCTLPR
jgi:hypothetical protein